MQTRIALMAALAALMLLGSVGTQALAQGAPQQITPPGQRYDERPPNQDPYGAPPANQYGSPPPDQYGSPPSGQYGKTPTDPYGSTPPGQYGRPPPGQYGGAPPGYAEPAPEGNGTYSMDEIVDAGHRFFGRVSMGLARVIEYAFSRGGRPNGYILGEEAGGAFVAGVRYGEGRLYTKDAGEYQVYWQGPSIGWDFGAEGSKTMVLVYNMRSINDIYNNFAGIDGSAYFIGGVGITFMSRNHVTLAPIRSGVGLRLGANIGYLKLTRRPTWNPF